MASAPIKKLPGQKLKMEAILFLNYKRELTEAPFPFQFKFRTRSINYIF